MKDIVAMVALAAAVSCVGWCFGTGIMHTEAAAVLLTCWVALTWSCMQD